MIENLTLIHALLSRRGIGVEFFNRKYNEIVEQGNAMHKEEIKNSYTTGFGANLYQSETYYNETFGGEQ